MAKKPLKVGFDLDGVLLYNPARIVRMPITVLKHMFTKKKKLHFRIPQSSFEKTMWRIFHWSSLFVPKP